ncbi:40S ribosomal protein S5-1 [Hordeum vulgare]|nr:40S ribosomal protein S5-1 [Hordeum vulgare]
MASPKVPKDKFSKKVINPYLAGVLQHPQAIEMREGVLHIRDVEGPKKTGGMEARLEAMEQQVFKCQGMVERGLNTNHMMITEFTNKHKIDANDIGKHLSRLYDRIDHLQAQIYDPQYQNSELDAIENKVSTIELIENLDKKIHNQITQYGFKVGMVLKNLKEKEPTVNENPGHDPARIGKLEDVITNLGSAFAAVQNTPNFAHNKITKSVFVPKSSGESSSNKDENLKMISDHATYGLNTKDDDT